MYFFSYHLVLLTLPLKICQKKKKNFTIEKDLVEQLSICIVCEAFEKCHPFSYCIAC